MLPGVLVGTFKVSKDECSDAKDIKAQKVTAVVNHQHILVD